MRGRRRARPSDRIPVPLPRHPGYAQEPGSGDDTMPSYKLTYFDFAGGRGEPIRIALHAAGVAFDVSGRALRKMRDEVETLLLGSQCNDIERLLDR